MHYLLRKQIKSIAFVAGLFSCFVATAQDYEQYRPEHDQIPYYFGITLAANSSYLHTTKSTRFLQDDSIRVANPGAGAGLCLGFLGTLRLADHFQLRINPQLVLGGGKSFTYTLNTGADTTELLPSTLISLPIHIKFNSDRIDNFQFYVLGGVRFDDDLSSNSAARKTDGLVQLKSGDFGLETGVGFNFYLPYVTLSPEIKFSYGLSNISNRDGNLKYSAVFDKIESRMITFSLHFED